jgi:small subunit ribosomal protein S2
MAIPEFSLRQLLEAGVHFGHQTHRWNPRMEEFIYGSRNGIHIMDLTQTVPMLDAALNVIQQTVSKGGTILFVGTKRQASGAIADAAERSAQYFMNHRWLGGTLTNWKTISNSISRLKSIDEQLEDGAQGMTKKERLGMEREQSKLQASLGGIREMNGVPNLLFVIDVKREALAVSEANKLGIPVIAVVDSNCAPEGVDYVIPGNDDAARAIQLYCDLAARAALDGMSAQLDAAGVDLGEMEEVSEDSLTPEDVSLEAQPESVEGIVDEAAELKVAADVTKVETDLEPKIEAKESQLNKDKTDKVSKKDESSKTKEEDKSSEDEKGSKSQKITAKKSTEKKVKKEDTK